MNTYLVIPLTAAIACTAIGCVILMMGVTQRANRLAGYLLLGGGYWAFCEVLWNGAPDALTAVWLHRISAIGWLFMAPLAIQLVQELTEFPSRRLDRLIPLLYASSFVFLTLTWTGPLVIEDMKRTSWGWSLVPGPVFGLWIGLTFVAISAGVGSWILAFRRSRADVDRVRGPIVAMAMATPFALGGVSDGLLPLAGVHLPRLGTLAFAITGGVMLWALNRYGYSRLSPNAFSRRILHTLPDGIVFTSLNGRIRVVNDRMAELLEARADEVVGIPVSDLLDQPICDPPREQAGVEGTLALPKGQGRSIPVSVSTSPLHDNSGLVMGVVVIVRDLREMAALRNRVMTSGRLAAVGQLAAGMAHEINNPLAYIRSNLNHLLRECESLAVDIGKHTEDEAGGLDDRLNEWEELIEESIDGVDRAATIVRDVREFSHAGDTGHEQVDLNRLLDQVLRVAAPQFAGRVRVIRQYAHDLPRLRCAPQRLKQLFLNLAVNAAQAIEGEGTTTVVTSQIDQALQVEITDDGSGVEPSQLQRIFDPFFTTKSVGEGTGLGLSISHQIVRDHQGDIEVESELGVGTTFRVTLPLGMLTGG